MIVSGILYLIYAVIWLITYPIQALPNAALPAVFNSTISTISQYLTAVYLILPAATTGLIGMFGVMLIFEASILAYKGVMWAIHRIPGQGGGSPG